MLDSNLATFVVGNFFVDGNVEIVAALVREVNTDGEARAVRAVTTKKKKINVKCLQRVLRKERRRLTE